MCALSHHLQCLRVYVCVWVGSCRGKHSPSNTHGCLMHMEAVKPWCAPKAPWEICKLTDAHCPSCLCPHTGLAHTLTCGVSLRTRFRPVGFCFKGRLWIFTVSNCMPTQKHFGAPSDAGGEPKRKVLRVCRCQIYFFKWRAKICSSEPNLEVSTQPERTPNSQMFSFNLLKYCY